MFHAADLPTNSSSSIPFDIKRERRIEQATHSKVLYPTRKEECIFPPRYLAGPLLSYSKDGTYGLV